MNEEQHLNPPELGGEQFDDLPPIGRFISYKLKDTLLNWYSNSRDRKGGRLLRIFKFLGILAQATFWFGSYIFIGLPEQLFVDAILWVSQLFNSRDMDDEN